MRFRHVIYGYWIDNGRFEEGELYSREFSRGFTKPAYSWFDKIVASLGKRYSLKMVKVRDSTLTGHHINLHDKDGRWVSSYELR